MNMLFGMWAAMAAKLRGRRVHTVTEYPGDNTEVHLAGEDIVMRSGVVSRGVTVVECRRPAWPYLFLTRNRRSRTSVSRQ